MRDKGFWDLEYCNNVIIIDILLIIWLGIEELKYIHFYIVLKFGNNFSSEI